MNKEFTPYKEASDLRELGFDEPCLAYYTTTNDVAIDKEGNKTNFILLSSKLRGELVGHGSVKNSLFKWLKENDKTSGELYTLSNSMTAPLYQQAFRWFREKYRLDGHVTFPESKTNKIEGINSVYYDIEIYTLMSGDAYKTYQFIGISDNKEKAELACLRKLIEIVKSKQ